MNSSIMVPNSPSNREDEGGMDWYAWLSEAGLEPTLAYEYALLFAHNELDEDDVPHFDHGFLLSMGVSVGKHRLQILRLAQKETRGRAPRPVVRLLAAADKARRRLARCLRSLAAGGSGSGSGSGGRSSSAALVAAQRDLFGGGAQHWRSAMLKRERKLALLKQGRLMLTDGCVRVTAAPPPPSPSRSPSPSPPPRSQSLSPVVFGRLGVSIVGEDTLWGGPVSKAEQEMRWDSMFHDLKPT